MSALLIALCALLPLALQEPAPAARPSLVLVTVDTLRREHLGCYGYPRATSPRVDALAREAVLFERAYAPMATTFPSHLSMLTGLYPHQHGHTSNRGAVRTPFEPVPGRLSLASALAAAGYRTAGFTSAVVLNARTGIGTGFQEYYGPKVKDGTRTARATMQLALDWLAGVPAGEPFFLWVHLWDVHEPNAPEPAYAELLAPDDTLRTWLGTKRLDLAALQAKFVGDAGVGSKFFGLPEPAKGPVELDRKAKVVRPRDPPRARGPAPKVVVDESSMLGLYARYDACVRQIDDEVGRLLDTLAARGSLDGAAFVFTADHGQSLGENDFFGHGVNTQVNTQIPLLVRFPAAARVAPQRSHALVSLVDLVPTLLAHAPFPALDGYREQLVGADVLVPGFARERVFTSESTEFHKAEKRPYALAVVSGRWKYVRAEGQAGRLFDLEGAGEALDVAAAHPERVAELEAQLATELTSSILDRVSEAGVDPAAAELLEQLEGLGYAGGEEDE